MLGSAEWILLLYDLVGSGHDYEFNAVEYRGCVDIIVHKNNNIWKYPLHPKPIHKKPSPRVSRSVIDDEGRLYPEVVVGAVRSDPDNL